MRLLFLFLIPLLIGCPKPNEEGLTKQRGWNPCFQKGDIKILSGSLRFSRSTQHSRWYGIDPALVPPKALPVLSDDREALILSTPSHAVADIPAANGQWFLRTALRIHSATKGKVHCEIFWADQKDGGVLTSLAQQELVHVPGEPDNWLPLRVPLPAGPGQIQLVCRSPGIGGLRIRGPEIAWATPLVIREDVTPPKPDVVLVTVDTLRADGMDHAPELRRVLKKGVHWNHAVAPSNWTLPSYGSLFSAQPPKIHGAGRGPFSTHPETGRENREFRSIRPDIPLLPESFRQAGYATAMFHQNPLLEAWTGLNRGFEQYTRTQDNTTSGLAIAQKWWEKEKGRPRFLVVHLMAPHLPYSPPTIEGITDNLPNDPLAALAWQDFLAEDHSPKERRDFFDLPKEDKEKVRKRYFGEVAALDSVLGPWVESLLTVNPKTILVFHSDHGEELWDEGGFEHGHAFHSSITQVPLAILAEGLAPSEIHHPVQVQDVGPTLLRIANVQAPRGWDGNLFKPTEKVDSSHPLFRANFGGVSHTSQGIRKIPFLPSTASTGPEPKLRPEEARALAELGYGGD